MEYLDELSFTGPPAPEKPGAQVRAACCAVPGAARPEELWTLLLGGGETQTEVAPDRWDVALYYAVGPELSGKSNAKHGAFLSNEELMCLDPQHFHLTGEEAAAMVPEQRLCLRLGLASLLEAGCEKGGHIDTYVGDCSSESRSYTGPAITPFCQSGAAGAVTANRLAYCFALRGETCAFDTACSSSLVALGHAHARLRLASTSTAVVMGVRVMLGPDGFVGLGAGGFLGLHGRCLTFDGSANGFGRGEGCCALVLDGAEELEASVQGSAVNQDGRSASLTAPNGPSQQQCISGSISMAQISRKSISVMECHGTGTSLGDPIEIGAIKGVLSNSGGLPLLTSSKSNVGHGEATAGLTGLLKCVLMLAHSMCPANVHLRVLNPNLESNGFPCCIGNESVDVGTNSQHLGVSSFGFGGTNARCDLWGHCQKGPRAVRPRMVVVPCPRCQQEMCQACGEVADDFALNFHCCEARGAHAVQCVACESESD